jgi:hypothetical protein
MKKILPLLLLLLVFMLAGCGGSGGSTPPCTRTGLTPGTTVRIYYTNPYYPTTIILTRVVPSTGSVTVPSYGYQCYNLVWVIVTNSNQALAASPSSVYLPSPPATATVTGQSFDTTYGMPMVEYFDGNGFMVGSVYATSVSGGGTSLQANLPDLSGAYSGTYQVKVTNKTSQGYYANIVGTATITAWGRDRLDSDGDGLYDDEDCDPYDPYNSNCVETCGGGFEPITVCP